MPLFSLVCAKCGHQIRKLTNNLDSLEGLSCQKCDGHYHRNGQGPTARIIEVRDNGLMPKKIEQLADIKTLIKTRSTGSDDSGSV